MENRDIKTLSTVEHIILRRQMYLGSSALQEYEDWIIENDKFLFKKISYVEGVKKILFEIIDNSVDEYIKTDGKYSTKINIKMDKTHFSCEDNGRGIPVKQNEKGEWMPYTALCVPMSGSNFTDDNRKSIGTNGLGGKICSIFSSEFEAVTCDGINKIKINTKNNLREKKIGKPSTSSKNGTKISFTLDFEKFGIDGYSDELMALIKTRLTVLSWYFPKCIFTFNDEKINIKTKDLTEMFPEHSTVLNKPNVWICIYPADEPLSLSYVNGIYLRRGGSHVDYILNKIISDIREKVSKKYKNIKPADIKNRLGIVCFLKDFPNCAFDSQTKETLTNSQADIGNYLKDNEIDLNNFSAKILKEKETINNITELFKLKEEIEERKKLDKINKAKKNIDSEKYMPPLGKTEKKYLMIVEGQSAFSGISPILGRRGIGYYMLRGKILNTLGLKPISFMQNQEVSDLVNILGIDLKNPDTDMEYEKVVILTDQDADGAAICGLVLTLFNTIAPKMVKDGRICRLETPLMFGSKNGKVVEYYFEIPPQDKIKKGLEWFYAKGLGSLTKDKFQQVLEKEGGMEGLMRTFSKDENADKSIVDWYGSKSEARKEKLRGREFHIDKA